MNIQAIASDLDDTLLDDREELSPFTLETLRACIRRGIHIIPASGRTLQSMRPFAEKIGVDCPYVACNGAQIVSADHQVLEQSTLPAPLAREIVSVLQQEGFYIQVYRDDAFFYAQECDSSLQYKKSSGMRGEAVGDLLSFLSFPVPKVLSVNHPREVRRVMPLMEARFGGRVTLTLSKPYFIEVMPPGISKASGLEKAAGLLGVPPENLMVFGDSLNDVSMLRFTPNSVAVENARPEAKEAARYRCPKNTEDGVARFIREHVLC